MSRMGPRKNLVGLGVAAMVTTGTVVGALQDQLTEEEYGPTMSEVRLLVGDAELHIDSFYWPELGEDLDKMFPMFRKMEGFWAARGNDDAVEQTQASLAALKEMGDAGVAMDRAQARAGLANLRSTCGSCHMAHREETDDGYRIKTGS